MKAKQYEIWIADLNPTTGTEPGKIRPVIIVQTDLLNKHHSSSIICPLTTNVQEGIEILRIHIKTGCCGLNEGCDIMTDQIRAIDNKRLIKKIGVAPTDIAEKIKESLKTLLDLG